MKEYIIEYSFGEDDKIKQIVESESDDLKRILMVNTAGERALFIDRREHLCSFKFSDVKYIKVYPYVKSRMTSKPTGM